MAPLPTQFAWMNRGFWLVWAAFPLFLWMAVSAILRIPDELAAAAPDQLDCIARLPQVVNFSAAGQTVFWAEFAVHAGFYAVVLALAHRVIQSCARGEMFVAALTLRLRVIGLTITLYPVVSLVLSNLAMRAYVATGDLPSYIADLALDLPTLGIGLLLVTVSMAMRQAMQLQEDADLTI